MGMDSTSSNEHDIPRTLADELGLMAASGKLRGLRSVRYDLVCDWRDSGLTAEVLCRRLSAFNRAVITAVLAAYESDHPWLAECTFLEFGSGGRGEQVLGSDQDNGLLVRGQVSPDELDEVTDDIVVALDGAGLPLCSGGVMINNPEWRGDFRTWLERMTGWLANPREKGPWQSGLILDFEPIAGPKDDACRLRNRLWEYVRNKPVVISLLVQELTDYRMPLTFFGSFITEKKGTWAGFLNIKNSILSHMINAVRILALKHGFTSTHTCDRVRELARAGHFPGQHGDDLLLAWEWLQGKRLEIGIDCHERGVDVHSCIDPARLSSAERSELRRSIQSVEKLVHLVQGGAGL